MPENNSAPANNPERPPGLSVPAGWVPSLDFYEVVCRQGIDPTTVRDYLPASLMRILVLLKKGWWLGTHWRVLNPDGRISRFNAISFHGPKGEFQPYAPADVLAMTRTQMVDFLLPNDQNHP